MKIARLVAITSLVASTFLGLPATASAANLAVMQLVTGESHTCILQSDGTVRCWGEGTYGQLGGGDFQDSVEPVDVANLTGVTQIAAGAVNTCAVTSAGSIYCWGLNDLGQLGDGTFDDAAEPVQVTGISTAVSVSLEEDHACALLADKTVACWGDNAFSQLGDDNVEVSEIPLPVINSDDVISVSVGWTHTCAVLVDGSVECWGFGGYGQFGNGDYALITDPNRFLSADPVPTSIMSGAVSVESGWFQSCALMDTGTVQCWGAATGLGVTKLSAVVTPKEISGLAGITQLTVAQDRACTVDTNKITQCWGESYRIGFMNSLEKYDVLAPRSIPGLNLATSVATGGLHTCALLAYGNAQCWGLGPNGQLGTLNATSTEWPVGVTALEAVERVPYPAKNLTAGTLRAQAVAFSWEKPDTDSLDIELYEITLQDGQGNRTQHTTTQESIVVTGLTSGQYYAGRVRARTAAGWGDITGWVNNRTAALPNPPSVITAEPGGFGEVVVTFTPRATDTFMPDKHLIKWKSLNTDLTGSAETAGTTYTITDMTPGDALQIEIIAHSEAGWNTGGNSVFGIAGGLPKKVINVTTSNITSNSVQVTWAQDPTDYRPATMYQIQYYTKAAGNKFVTTSDTTYKLTGLVAKTAYTISVTAQSEFGWGTATTPVTVTTAAPASSPYKVVKVVGKPSPKKLVLTWTPPYNGGSPISNYAVRYRITGTIKFSAWINAGLKPTLTIKNLKKGKTYDIQVRAKNSIGISEGYVVKIKQTR